jgi:hypothetical protein
LPTARERVGHGHAHEIAIVLLEPLGLAVELEVMLDASILGLRQHGNHIGHGSDIAGKQLRKLLRILHGAAHKCLELGVAQAESILNRAAHFAHALQRIGSAQRGHESIGQCNDLHDGRLVRQRIVIAVMGSNRLDDGFGKMPAFGEGCADGWMVESEGLGARVREQLMLAAALG